MKIGRLAVLCLLAAACGGTPRTGTPATPAPESPMPAGAVIIDKDQTLAPGAGKGEAPSLADLFAAASRGSASPVPSSRRPASPVPATPAPTPSVQQVFEGRAFGRGRPAAVPNPGGPGDPRLRQALLVHYEGAGESVMTPAAVVALPAAVDDASRFLALRQVAGGSEGPPACRAVAGGAWRVVLRDFNRPGVRIAATLLSAMSDEAWKRSAEFSETIVTGPAPMLANLGDPAVMGSCRTSPGEEGYPIRVRPFPVPPLGARSWAFRVMEGKTVTQWVEMVQTPRYVLEIRVPDQWPKPRVDPAVLLPRIAEAAYVRAEAALR
ncbi:hypothetical protein AAH991_07625 [Microbispora sp. ZYX-F-249]|uniref:Uncharacterized protein n=1 Tax=Microbispora maris TaxID=3144104 RepID=A0ABV0AJX6_9ACTN